MSSLVVGGHLAAIWSETEFLASLAGAFFGAVAAFVLAAFQSLTSKRHEEQQHIIKAQYILAQQAANVENLQRFMEEAKNLPNREHVLQFLPAVTSYSVSIDTLTFLLLSKKPNIVPAIDRAQAFFEGLRRGIDLQNKAKQDLITFAVPMPDTATSGMMAIPQDHRTAQMIFSLKQATDNLYRAIPETMTELERAQNLLLKTAREAYPEKHFPKVNRRLHADILKEETDQYTKAI